MWFYIPDIIELVPQFLVMTGVDYYFFLDKTNYN